MITLTMPVDINAGQFLAFSALALLTGATIGFVVAMKIAERLK